MGKTKRTKGQKHKRYIEN